MKVMRHTVCNWKMVYEVLSPIVISSAGIFNTYKKLLSPKVSDYFKLHEQLSKIKRSTGHMCLYIGLKHPKLSLNLGKANFWIFPDKYNHDENLDQVYSNRSERMIFR
jgi:all-trans-retinol 13,14-reductase